MGDGLVVFLDGSKVRLRRGLLIITSIIFEQEAPVSASHSTERLLYGLNSLGKRKDDTMPEYPGIGPSVQLLNCDLSSMMEKVRVARIANDQR